VRLKNYTSAVSIDQTISRIERALAGAGATGIMKEYKDGMLSSLSFHVRLPTGRIVAVRLPANHEAVYQTMQQEVKRPRNGTMEKLRIQAMRTSWKLMQDWVEVQLSLIVLHQVDFMQVFLPYVWDGKRTFYAALKEKQFLALPEVCDGAQD
jgi:hypothetical protein